MPNINPKSQYAKEKHWDVAEDKRGLLIGNLVVII